MAEERVEPAARFYLLHLGGALLLAGTALLMVDRLRVDWWISNLFLIPGSGVFR